MKLQVALDFTNMDELLECAAKVKDYADILEVGSPAIWALGIEPVRRLRELYPDKCILADLKVMDGGYQAGTVAYEAGADIFTVLGTASDEVIKGAVKAAKEYGKKVNVDLVSVPNLFDRAYRIKQLGADCVLIHTGTEERNDPDYLRDDELGPLTKLVDNESCGISGGITPDRIKTLKQFNPGIIIVGSFIVFDKDPLSRILEIRAEMDK